MHALPDVAALTQEEFRKICEFIYRRTGMLFGDAKRYYVERRVADRMARTRSPSFELYFSKLRADLGGEIEHLINAFTINETYFYREEHQLACLTADLLGARLKVKQRGEPIRIWSLPCSTGEEPYSIAIWLLENWQLVDQFDIEIVASDIDTHVLELAREGMYGKRALSRLPPPVVRKYFTPHDGEMWQIVDELRGSVSFSQVNVIERAETRPQGKFDVVFCRNVLIYFDDLARRTAAENLFENLLPGGFICLGHTESMSRISPLFDVAHFPNAIVYQRPAR